MSNPEQPQRPSDLEVLQEIQDKIIEELRAKDINPRVGDLLKAMELKLKFKLTEEQRAKIWELINQLRADELPAEPPESPVETDEESEGRSADE